MKKKILVAAIFTGLFVCLTFALMRYDVAQVGPQGSSVGFSQLNTGVFNALGENKVWDKITDVLLIVSGLVGLAFFAIGLKQLITRKSLKKVDYELFALAGLYLLVGAFYLLFDKIIINYRPVLVDGKMVASFPSSHTLASCTLLWSAGILLGKYVKDRKLCRGLQIACIVLPLVTAFGRLLAGMHWLTDVLGGIFLSGALVFAFWCIIDLVETLQVTKKQKAPRK